MASKSCSLETAAVELLLGEVTRAANHRIAFHCEAVKRKKERKCSFQCENRTAPHSLNKSLSTVRTKFRSETSRAMRTAAAEESVADFALDEIKVEHVKIKASDVFGRLINALKAGRFVSFFFQVFWRNANSQMDGQQVGRLSSSRWMSAIKTFFARTCSLFKTVSQVWRSLGQSVFIVAELRWQLIATWLVYICHVGLRHANLYVIQ